MGNLIQHSMPLSIKSIIDIILDTFDYYHLQKVLLIITKYQNNLVIMDKSQY